MSQNLLSLNENSDSDSSDEDYVPNDNEKEERNEDGNSSSVESGDDSDEEKLKRKSKQKVDGEVSNSVEQQPQQKSVDELWREFLSDTTNETPSTSKNVVRAVADSTNCSDETETVKLPTDKVVITKVYDFAGEEIKVTKEVDANSIEALRQLDAEQNDDEQKPTVQESKKRPSGLSGVLTQIGKKQKMGTLEKSKLDWESFKKTESLDEELATHNRGREGFLEKQDFLQRADYRQFERERDLRLSKRKNV